MSDNLDLAVVMASLRDNGVHYVGCYYSGSGDSGEIEQLCYYGPSMKESFETNDLGIDYGSTGDVDIDLDKIIEGGNQFLEDLFYKNHLNLIEDWYNDDGGFGSLLMDTETGEFKNENNQYYTQTNTFHHSGKMQVK